RELPARHPLHFLAQERRGASAKLASKEVELYAAVGVIVRGRQEFFADFDRDAKLLANLADQSLRMALSRLALAAGEFPVARRVPAFLPPRHEKRIVVFDDRRHDDERRHVGGEVNGAVRQSLAIGQTRHLGLRATQTIAPKSMIAWLKSNTRRTGTSVADRR